MLKINKDIQIGDTGRTLEMLGETVAETLPVGTIAPYGGSTSQVPQNWLPCDGREVSRLEYAKLFSVIGTRFGTGDGSTTFNLPDLQGRVPVGQDVNDAAFDVLGETGGEKTHTLTVEEIPSHNHITDPILYKTGYNYSAGNNGNISYADYSGSGSISYKNTGGGQAHNNLQPYQVTLYIIKAFDQQLGNLRSESLPVGSELDFDGTVSEIPEGWEQTTDVNSYSTDEIKTNKRWIDGKPIYRKVVEGNMSQENIAHNIQNLEEVTMLYAVMYNPNSGKRFSIPSVRPNYNAYEVGLFIDNTNITLERASNVQSNYMIIKIIIEYTKTTD